MTGVRYAIGMAKSREATLHGLHVVDIKLLEGPFLRDISASLGTAPYVNYQGNIALILEERGKAALAAFVGECEAAKIASEVSLETGHVARTIAERAGLTDLVVMGRTGEHTQWIEGFLGSATQSVARRSEAPLLVTGTDTPETERYLLAYDGSQHARHALQVAADFSAHDEAHLQVLAVGEQPHAGNLLQEASDYLRAHAIRGECIAREGDPSETIVQHAAECEANLLFMGAYGHSKVRELVIGSTTDYAMNHAPCPLLLAR